MSYIITRISSACKTVRGHLMVLLRRLVDKYGVWYIYIAKEGQRMIFFITHASVHSYRYRCQAIRFSLPASMLANVVDIYTDKILRILG